jgi:hypothetical protein
MGVPVTAALAAAQAGGLGIGFRCAPGAAVRPRNPCLVATCNSAASPLLPRAARLRFHKSRARARFVGPAGRRPPPPPRTPLPHPASPSGGGFILPFFLGVIDMLYRDLGVMQYSYPAGGGSTGSIATS